MSAYFVADATIDAVVTLLRRRSVHTIPDSEPELARFCVYSPAMSPDACGRQLLELNADAMLARYPSIRGTQEAADMAKAARAYRFTARNENDASLAKSLACYLYQCSEGEVPDRALFRALRQLEQAVTPPPASATLWRDPAGWAARREYDAAPWGLEA